MEQQIRLRTAQACFEVIPSFIMTPIIYRIFKLIAAPPTDVSSVRFGKLGLQVLMSFICAFMTRDVIYWPIVAKIYSELNEKNSR